MDSIWDIPFIVVDVETTGADAKNNRITDIACVTVLGGKIIAEFSSLVNPHQSIPPFISQMTGITYDMVINAPEAKDVFEVFKNMFANEQAIFVAHNSRFDLGFVNQTLLREGFEEFKGDSVCTLKLARRLLPTKLKKNVGSLSDYFNIPVYNRHRALGDASATAKLLIQFLGAVESEHNIKTKSELLRFQNRQIKHFQAPSDTQKRVEEQIKLLPDAPGCYKFLDKRGHILYIGKAKSLKDRVKSYFNKDTFTSKKIAKMFRQIYKIQWECTNTELQALLLESKEIKKYKPLYNTIDKKYKSYPFIKLNLKDEFPFLETSDSIEGDGAEYYGPIRSIALAEEIILNVERAFKIRKCEDKLKPLTNKKPCFYYHIEQCLSPCSGAVTREEYMKEVEKVKLYLSGLPEGIIYQMESKMQYHSERLEFEQAEQIKRNLYELKKLFAKDDSTPNSIGNNNAVILIPASEQDRTLDVYMIKTGKLNFQETIGRKADLSKINNSIHEIFYNGNAKTEAFTKEDIDEIRIMSNWMNKQNGIANFLYPGANTESDFLSSIEYSIRNMKFSEETQNEYSE